MENYNKLKSVLDSVEKDIQAFYEKGNKAAGTRVRKGMLEVKNLAHEIRKEISEKKNS